MLSIFGTSFYAFSEPQMDIELLEFIGLWEPGSDPSNVSLSTEEPNQTTTIGDSWRDPFETPLLEVTNIHSETTESL